MKFVNLNLSYHSWVKTNHLTTAIRIAITGIIFAIFGAPHFIVNGDVDPSQIYRLLLFKALLPSFGFTFLLFAFGRALFYKLKLVNENSVGRMFEMNDEEEGDFT